ncbi:MAG: hypothetical protein GY818_07580 [Planctomycetaceae bacterium]|nr:hypothetical protein [Planctomycetaceae bacterium]
MTIPDHYPIPNIHDIYGKLSGHEWFSALDLRHGYHHLEVRPEDRYKTAFITHHGLFEFNRMTFGFVNAPAAFQRAMDYIFRDLSFVVVYIDDILIMSKTEEEHMRHLRIVFEILETYNLVIRKEKCQFFVKELKYLGFILSGKGMRPDPEYIQKVIDLPDPTRLKELKHCLGMVTWLHRYIPRMSDYLFPLTEATKTRGMTKNQLRHRPWSEVWTKECQEAWEMVKTLVKQTQLLRHPDMSKEFFVVTDASDVGIGAVLMQEYSGVLEPVEFWSSKLQETQQHWYVGEKELYGIVATIEHWQKFLKLRKFTVYTDHKNLENLQKRYNLGLLKQGTLE